MEIIDILYKTIIDRKINKIEESYTNYLFSKGKDKILKKIGEETTEVIIAAKNKNKSDQVEELCDLTYHLLVLMVELNIDLSEISEVLEKRNKKMCNLKKERADVELL